MRAPRSVTLAPIASPARILKDAIALRDLVISGFCPVILVRSATAASITFLSATASPTPMLIVILAMRGTCIDVVDLQLRAQLRQSPVSR